MSKDSMPDYGERGRLIDELRLCSNPDRADAAPALLWGDIADFILAGRHRLVDKTLDDVLQLVILRRKADGQTISAAQIYRAIEKYRKKL